MIERTRGIANRRRPQYRAFSLLELAIVVAIIAVIAAIGIPRLSRGTRGAAKSAVVGNLAVLRQAIHFFVAEHADTYPTVADIAEQLTQYTDALGHAQATKDTTHIYGPYLRRVPPLPVGVRKGATGIAAADGPGVGWIYDESDGSIKANTTVTERDISNKLYSTY